MSRSRDIAKFAGSSSVFSYPTTDGADGQVLTTDGAGNLLLEAASSGGAGVTSYTNASDLPLSGNTAGDLAYVNETGRLYVNNGTGWYNVSLVNTNPSITSVQDASSNTTPFSLTTDGTATVITITASDPEEVPLTYSYSVTSGSLTNGGGTTATVTQGTGSNTNVFTITPTTTEDYAGSFTLTFTASDGINQATSANIFSLQFNVAMDAETVFSMGTSTTNALANDTFVDRSSSPITLTSVGSPVQSSFNPYLDNWSVYFDGSGDYLRATSSVLAEGTDDFTLECWFYMPTSFSPTENTTLFGHDATPGYQISWYSGGFVFMGDTSVRVLNTSNVTTDIKGAWHHIAYCRSGNTLYGFLDGQSIGTSTNSVVSTNFTNTTIDVGVNRGGTEYFQGWISNLRIVKGTAVYTSSFTPPTEALTAISGTQLLTCQSNRFLDNSTNGHTITANGNAAIYSFNPYGQPDQYSLASNQGSFANPSGTNSYLTSTKILPTDGSDCTIEFWFYWEDSGASTYGGDQGLFDQYAGGASGRTIIWLTPSLKVEQAGSATITSSTTIREKTWYHLAFVIDNGTGELFLNGVSQGSSGSYIAFADTDAAIGTYNRSDLSRDYAFRGHISDLKVTASAKYTAAFTPPTEPLGDTSATFYLPSDNAGIFDKSGANAIAVNGDAQTSTTQTKYSSTSVSFDGTGDYVSIPYDETLTKWWATDYTLECWVKVSNLSNVQDSAGNPNMMGHTETNTSSNYWSFGPMANGSVRFYYFAGSAQNLTTSSGFVGTSNWHHLAFVFVASTNSMKIYIDGTERASTTLSTTPQVNTSHAINIGHGANSSGFYGYIEDLRITKGLARYTENFTAPTAALEG